MNEDDLAQAHRLAEEVMRKTDAVTFHPVTDSCISIEARAANMVSLRLARHALAEAKDRFDTFMFMNGA